MTVAAAARGHAPLDDVHGQVDQRDEGDADEHLAEHHAVVVDLYPEDAGEQREREQHAYPHGVVQLRAQVHAVASPPPKRW